MSDANHTLQHLAEQQKQCLIKQKVKQAEKEEEMKNKPTDKKENKGSYKHNKVLEGKFCKCSVDDCYDNFDGVEDELDLKLGIKFANVIETDDFKELQEAIRELRDENGRISKLLAEKEEEIKIIRRRWKEDKQDLTGSMIGSDNVAAKIIEFSKKIRDLNAELNKEKTKGLTYKRQVEDLEKKVNKVPQLSPTKLETEKQMIELGNTKERLTQALLKSAEERNEIESLKKELKIAQKVLTREVGENVSFQSLLNSSAGWRGRQQQILTLHQKNKDLQKQINELEKSASAKTGRNAFLNGQQQNHHDEKHRLVMRKMEIEKKEQQEKLQKELEIVTQERNSLKEKNTASKARIKILSQDVKSVKGQLKTLSEKGKHDDELVSALLREQQILKTENEKLHTKLKDEKTAGERVLRASGTFAVDENEGSTLIEKLKEEIHIQESKVKQLESELLEIKSARRSDKSYIPRPPGSSAGRRADSLTRRPLSGGSAPLNSPIESQLTEMKALMETVSVEKDKFNELVQILQERNRELTQEAVEKEARISEYKNRNAQLEKQLEKMTLPQNSAPRPRGSSNNAGKNLESLQNEILELETKLSIQMENNDALKDALSTTLKSKDDDLKVYHQMVEQTKRIFLQGLRQFRASSAT